MEIIYLVIGLGLGAAIGFLIAKQVDKKNHPDGGNLERVKAELDAKSLLLEEIKGDNLKKEQLLESRQKEIQELSRLNAQLDQQLIGLKEKLDSQKSDLEKLNEKFTHEFQNLANSILEEKSKKFTEQNKTNLGELLIPLREKIVDFEKKVDQSNKDNLQHNSALREQLKNLKELNQQITKDAENLTRALKGETKTQGNWGEFILESILEKSGLSKGREYFVQESSTSEEGRRLQPDVVVKLPDNKNIIIDSKVTLVAYERYVSSDEDTYRDEQLKMHIQSVRKHIKDLSDKNYQNIHGVQGLDFVLMFIPIEPAFSLAVQYDAELFSDAYTRNIVIVSPSTLIATLRTIANIWKNEYQNRNAMEIAEQGGKLYDKFVAFTEDLMTVGKDMDRAKKSYVAAMNKLSEGRGNLIGQTEKIKKLGAKAGKQIDEKLILRSLDTNEEE